MTDVALGPGFHPHWPTKSLVPLGLGQTGANDGTVTLVCCPDCLAQSLPGGKAMMGRRGKIMISALAKCSVLWT